MLRINKKSVVVCGRCESEVQFSEVSPGYFGYCPNHDEDLWEWETETVNKTFKQIDSEIIARIFLVAIIGIFLAIIM